MGKYIKALILVLIFSSCISTKETRRAERANKKLERLAIRYPELLKKDTIKGRLTAKIAGFDISDVVLLKDGESAEISKENVNIRMNRSGDSIQINVKKKDEYKDFEYEEVVNRVETKIVERKTNWVPLIAISLFIALILRIVFYDFRR